MGETDVDKLIRSNRHFRESRLRSLYSNFDAQKQLNPEGYEANISAWNHLLHDILLGHKFHDGAILSFSSVDPNLSVYLSDAIYGRPLSLGTVLEELVKDGVLIPWSQFGSKETATRWSWIQWGLERVGVIRSFTAREEGGELKRDRYINRDILIRVANELIQFTNHEVETGTYSKYLFDSHRLYDMFKKKEPTLSSTDFEILLIYLSRNLQVCKVKRVKEDNDDKVYVKFSNEEVNDVDVGIIKIETSLINIEVRNDSLKQKIKDMDDQIKQLTKIKSNNKDDLKDRLRHYMQLKQILNQSLNKGIKSGTELHQILNKIHESKQNINIYQQLVNSGIILNQLNSQVNMDDIAKVKQELSVEFSKSDAIAHRLNMEEEIDEESIENELQLLYDEVVGGGGEEDIKGQVTKNSTSTSTSNKEDNEMMEQLERLTIDESHAKQIARMPTAPEADLQAEAVESEQMRETNARSAGIT